MRQIREFRSNFENISRDCRAIVVRLSHDSRAIFVRVSHDRFPRMYLIFILIRTTVARQSCECRTTFVRMSLSFIFSPDSREIFTCCLKTVARPSCDTRTTFVRVSPIISHCKFAKISRRQVRDIRTNVARQSCEMFWKKNSHPIFKHV